MDKMRIGPRPKEIGRNEANGRAIPSLPHHLSASIRITLRRIIQILAKATLPSILRTLRHAFRRTLRPTIQIPATSHIPKHHYNILDCLNVPPMHDGYGHVRYMALMGIVKCLWATCYQCSAQGGAYDIHIANSWKPVTPSGDLSPIWLKLLWRTSLECHWPP